MDILSERTSVFTLFTMLHVPFNLVESLVLFEVEYVERWEVQAQLFLLLFSTMNTFEVVLKALFVYELMTKRFLHFMRVPLGQQVIDNVLVNH